MPRKKQPNSVTLKQETVTYAVQVGDDQIISVEAASAEEAVNKAKAKGKEA